MSRIGNKVIKLPEGVTATVGERNHVLVSGPKGKIEFNFSPVMEIKVDKGEVHILRPSNSIEHRSLHGTTRATLHNMVEGVEKGFSKTLTIEGVGYRAQLQGDKLIINAGYSHLVEMPVPTGITVKVPSPTEINISGIDKQQVGQFAAEVRLVRKPEPYKGKGIRYKDEVIRRKEGKKAK